MGWIVLLLLWVIWIAAFALRRRGGGQKAAITIPRARWGMLLEGLGFALASMHAPSQAPPSLTRVSIGLIPGILAIVLAYWSVSALGKQWRFDAALSQDHDLIQTGPYAIVRHPIYASMLLMLVTNGLFIANWVGLCLGLICFFFGTEIRVRTEEGLLTARFGERYEEYRRRVPAYLPGIR